MPKLPVQKASSGNVFADLGLPNADELLLKAQIVTEISRLMKLKKLTQAKPPNSLELPSPTSQICCAENSVAFP
jgi:predicted XRE-type DNA-binding protein